MEGLALLVGKQEAAAEAAAAEAADLPEFVVPKRALWCDMAADDSDHDDNAVGCGGGVVVAVLGNDVGEKNMANFLGVPQDNQELAAAQALVSVVSSENKWLNARVLDLERDRDAIVEVPKASENQKPAGAQA